MDGPMSRFPSSSVASVAAQRSIKESNSAPNSPNSCMDPPRPAREGHEWVWFPAGYWAEREVAESPGRVMKHFKWRKRSGKSSSGKDTQDDPDYSPRSHWDHTTRSPYHLPSPFLVEDAHVQPLHRPPLHHHGTSSESGKSSFPLNRALEAPLPSPYLTEEAHVQSLQRSPLSYQGTESGTSLPRQIRPMQSSPLTIATQDSGTITPLAVSVEQPTNTPVSLPSLPHLSPATPEAKPKASFIARLLPDRKSKTKKTHSDNDSLDYTRNTIEGAQAQLLGATPPPFMSRVASLLREETRRPRSFKLFGKSPWHRKASAGSEASASSSIIDVLRGRTPVTSPVSDTGQPIAPYEQFPGGEATRVQTPPLYKSGHHDGRPRSFFFDVARPPQRSDSHRNSHSDERNKAYSSPLISECDDVLQLRQVLLEEEEEEGENENKKEREKEKRGSGKEWWEVPAAVPRYQPMNTQNFEFDMPEHLPTSPMCPTNRRHKSGGTGVCVYHGRRKGVGFANNEQSSDDDGEEDGDGRVMWT
ncbi:hypothetical protein F4677DRAFT_45436 [Hypoxylon crocopeplum]|nr:hypothetical protein F4677DRAFT_45436 [Hypoxylon crocopeplum]